MTYAGRPSSITDENVEHVREIVRVDRRITQDAIASELGILHGSVHSTLHDDLNFHRVCLPMVLRMLSHEQEEMRVNMPRDLIDMTDEDDSFLKKIVIGNETWCFLNNKNVSSGWKAKTLLPRKENLCLDKNREKMRRRTEGTLKMDSGVF
ncbi:uncharacterized protein TNCV_488091 [Trichonephila clavipes]|nr:uncharacterized protein TNCV_488091 [Trichonephila clavipes]